MKQAIFSLLIVLIFLSLPACGGQPITPVFYTPTPDPATQEAAMAATATQNAIATQATESAVATAKMVEREIAAATFEAGATETVVFEATQAQATADFQGTQTAQAQTTATAEAGLLGTQTAQPMQALIESLKTDGFIKNTGGAYYRLPDFDKSWAQLSWYRWWESDYSPENFVIRADTSWWSASNIADWWASGCGVVFHETDADNHYFIGLALDGYVYLNRVKGGVYANLLNNSYGKVDVPNGSAQITLAVENGWITFLVNGKKVLRTQDTGLNSGKLAMSLVSGTNKDFGTRCQMKNIELWVLDNPK